MIVRKFNYYKLGGFISVLLFIIVLLTLGIIKLVNSINYKKSYEYKLINIGYNVEEINILEEKLKSNELDFLLTQKYDSNIPEFCKEKFFLYKNLDKYLDYKKGNKKIENTKIVSIINTEANIEWIDVEKETNILKNELMLVNRLYGLSSDYEPEDIVTVSSQYAYDGVKIREFILNDIKLMIDAAKEEGYTFVLSSGYRSYKEQEKIFNSYKNSYGYEEADKYVARPGHSEYQTGISFDIVPYNKVLNNPKESEEYTWLRENSYKFGFIFRFDENKSYLTQFPGYTWRLRYVGSEAATLMYNENICFEEYYAYFVDKE